ncbi:hypothetical protein QVD17_32034 [Tagetes erecta]|uniref:Uncharacterized protein n=1 Tax=Tagetes erecta TaxID=13708 RepID=A0AAD8KB28_TARER|nr:hypothetical protein QVD17_32034 [Tagetes erecta]
MHFMIRDDDEVFLYEMLEKGQYKAAERWAVFLGKSALRKLIQGYIQKDLKKQACELMRNNKLTKEFPEVKRAVDESAFNDLCNSLKKLAEKGEWVKAEKKTKSDKQVFCAMEFKDREKVEELCKRYKLKVEDIEGRFESFPPVRYITLEDLNLTTDDIIWVDDPIGLKTATSLILNCREIGLDCEWKPSYEKGTMNKVRVFFT